MRTRCHTQARTESYLMSDLPEPAADNDALLVRARAGDAEALGLLTERFRPFLEALARRVLSDRLPGQDSSVVQDGFAAALGRLDQFRGISAAEFLGWLTAIVRNNALDRLRRAQRVTALPNESQAG